MFYVFQTISYKNIKLARFRWEDPNLSPITTPNSLPTSNLSIGMCEDATRAS